MGGRERALAGRGGLVLPKPGGESFVHQSDAKLRKKPVRGANDLLRGAFTDDSVRALAHWILGFRGKSGPRAFPLDPVAIGEAGRWLDEGKSLPPLVMAALLEEGPLGRRCLLAANLIHPGNLPVSCHDAWPSAEEAGKERARWDHVATRFLEAATANGLSIPWSVMRDRYLSNPWLADHVRARNVVAKDESVSFPADGRPSQPLADNTPLRFRDAAPCSDEPPPAFPSAPLTVKEWKARCRALGLKHDRTNGGDPYAFAVDPMGTFTVVRTGYGAGFGGDDAAVHVRRITAERGATVAWAYEKGSERGWASLDPT